MDALQGPQNYVCYRLAVSKGGPRRNQLQSIFAITGQFLLAAYARNDCDRRAQYFKLVVCIDRVHFGRWRGRSDSAGFLVTHRRLSVRS